MKKGIKLYHWAEQRHARQIVDHGFSKSSTPLADQESSSTVLVRDTKHNLGQEKSDSCLLEIVTDLTPDELGSYENVNEAQGHTEWCIPAKVLDGHCDVRLFTAEQRF